MIDIIFHDETGIAPCLPGQMGGFENTDGDGEIHYYRLFDGVGIMLLRLEMESYTEIRTQAVVLEINFCINGRFETSFSMRDRVLLKPGDMAVSCYDGFHGSRSESCFPLGYYEGICLEVDPEAASSWISQNAPAFRVDFSALKEDLLDSKWYMVGSAGSRCEHVFRELYESAPYADHAFLQLKALELLLLLERIPQESGRNSYQVYGVPVYRYIKEYRLEQAAVELVRSGKPITEIAQHAGYDNASKFSESFKKRYGKTPSRYRADKKDAVKRSIETKTE